MAIQPGTPEITPPKAKSTKDTPPLTPFHSQYVERLGPNGEITRYRLRQSGEGNSGNLYDLSHPDVDFWRINQYRTLMENTIKPYKVLSSKMHDIELFSKPESRQRPIVQKNLQDSLNQLLGGATILSSEISRTMREATQEGSVALTIGSFFKHVANDGPRSNLEIPLSWLATSSFEGYTMVDTLARYVYGVKAEPADITTQRESQQQDIPQRLEKLLDTQIPMDVLKSAAERLRKNPVGITLSMLLQEVSRSYPPFMDNIAENLSSQQPIEQQSAHLMLKTFQEFIATYPEPMLIKDPPWKEWYNRIKNNRLLGKPLFSRQSFTPEEMLKILIGAKSRDKSISKKTDQFMSALHNAPSQVGKMTMNDAMEQVKKTYPDGIIPGIEAAAKTNAALNNQPFEGRLPLSPNQERYIRRVRKEDRESIRYYLEQNNYLLNLYQKYVGLF